MVEESIISWNCRGAGSTLFIREMSDIRRRFNPKIIALMEPKISGDRAAEVCRSLGKSHWVRSEAQGFSGGGGVWLLWDDEEVSIMPLEVDKSFIHVLVSSGGMTWRLTAVYAIPNATARRSLWDNLNELEVNGAWVIIGDFNCVLKGEERSSGNGVSSSFAAWVKHKGLIDLGFIGQPFTWMHGSSVETRKAARLDRGMCDSEWRRLFPSATIRHLAHGYSDHCPLLLQLRTVKDASLGSRPFRFEAVWLLHRDFHGWLEREWEWEGCLNTALRKLAAKLDAWNRDTFGNIFRRKKRNILRLEGVQRALGKYVSERLLYLEEKLKEERSLILLQEELLWKQKSRNDWLKEGDGNTKFFHTSTLVRRRRNKIEALQNARGEWIEDKAELKSLAV